MTSQLYQFIDQFQLQKKSTLHIQYTFFMMCICSLPSINQVQAKPHTQTYLVDEFNQSNSAWTLDMSTARSTGRGWTLVQHDHEEGIRNNPSSSLKEVTWQLSRTVQIAHHQQNFMQIKSFFKKHTYQDFSILVRDQTNQLHVIHQQTQADRHPQSRIFDMQQFSDQKVDLILRLRKPRHIKEGKVGLYLHKVQLYVENISSKSTLKIAAFNIQIFGRSKMSKPQVVDALLEVLPVFDMVFIQEIRDASGESLAELMHKLDELYPNEFAITVSERLGRTRSKEQYAYLYRIDQLQLVQAQVADDPHDVFERPPYITSFIHVRSNQELTFIGAHLSPSVADLEIQALYDVVNDEFDHLQTDESLFVMGDLNADCRYLTQTERQSSPLLHDTRFTSYIHDDLDTTTTATDCAYDRLLSTVTRQGFNHDTWNQVYITQSGVYHFDDIFKYDEELTKKVSDHYPVWIELQLQTL